MFKSRIPYGILLILAIVNTVVVQCSLSQNDETEKHNQEVAKNHLTTQIFAIIEHYKNVDPVGLPGASIPDPFPVPDIKKSMAMGTLSLLKAKAYGMSKFRLKSIKTDLNLLTVNATVQLDSMKVNGSYTLSSFFTKANGTFVVILKNVIVNGNVSLGVDRTGKLRTQDIQMDVTFSDMAMDFQNLGFMGSVFQSVVNSAPNLVFDVIKPFMLQEAYVKMREEIDTNIDKITKDFQFSNSISPLDLAISEGRKRVRDMGFDPFQVKNYNHTVGMFSVQLSNTYIMGISSFYRVGDILISLENNTITIGMQIGTQKIQGAGQWEVSVASGMITRAGQVKFTIEHIKAEFLLSQSLDTRKRPYLKDLQLQMGNIQVRCEGAGTLDYLTEFLVNILPNLLRYQIMDAIENPIKQRIQEKLNEINVEAIIKEKLPEFQKMGMNMTFNFKI